MVRILRRRASRAGRVRCLGAAAGALLALACGPAEPARPNVLVVSVDALRRDALPVYDENAPSLPHLEAFASGAAVFDRALAPSSWTLPSHASLFTGRYPHGHGAVHPDRTLGDAIPTWAGVLRRAGWTTVAFTDGDFMGRPFGLERGFERYDDWVHSDGAVEIPGLPRGGRPADHPRSDTFGRARAFLRSREPGDPPFFLFAHTYAVHHYVVVPGSAPRAERQTLHFLQCILGQERCGEQVWARLRARYRAEVRRLDHAFGMLLETLEARSPDRETLVIVLSDHGEGFDPERGRIHHGGRLHGDQLRIPLLIRGNGVTAGRVDTPTSLVDVMPTVLAWLGVPRPPDLDGRALSGALRGDPPAREAPLYGMAHAFAWSEGGREVVDEPGTRPHAVARIGPAWWLLLERGDAPAWELYAVADRSQRHDLSRLRPGLVERLADGLEAAFQTRAESDPVEMPAPLRRRLEAIGYLDDEEGDAASEARR